MVDSSYNLWRLIIASIMIITFVFILIFGPLIDNDSNILTLNQKDKGNPKSTEKIDLILNFENETLFSFQIPVIYISDDSQDPSTVISPAFEDLTLVEEKSDYTNISISILSNSINGSLIEYFQINGSGRVFSFHSEKLVDVPSMKPIFNQSNNPMYLETINNNNMTLSLEYFGQDANIGPTTGCELYAKLYTNVIIENGWKLYEFNEQITMACH